MPRMQVLLWLAWLFEGAQSPTTPGCQGHPLSGCASGTLECGQTIGPGFQACKNGAFARNVLKTRTLGNKSTCRSPVISGGTADRIVSGPSSSAMAALTWPLLVPLGVRLRQLVEGPVCAQQRGFCLGKVFLRNALGFEGRFVACQCLIQYVATRLPTLDFAGCRSGALAVPSELRSLSLRIAARNAMAK